MYRVYCFSYTHTHTQWNFKELQMDADHIFSHFLQNPAYNDALQQLKFSSANQAVAEAMQVLHTAQGSEGKRVLSTAGEMVVSLLQQWIICHLCKRLMWLMTPEALTLHRNKIPATSIDNSFTYQYHFSLKGLIFHHYQAAKSCSGWVSVCLSVGFY